MSTIVPRPGSSPAPRLAPLAKLPVFLALRGRPVLLVGGGEPTVWKAELLAAAGASLRIVAPEPHPDVVRLALTLPDAALEEREWRPEDCDGMALVVADAECDEDAAAIAKAARARGVPVNVIDRPAFCDFQFGTVVNRSPVVVGIMTDGAAPILGQAIRRRIEAILPASLPAWAEAAKAFRAPLARLLPERTDRRRFWERFVDRVFGPETPGEERRDVLERLAGAVRSGGSRPAGEVVIVGAGPGDPELLTLKAMRELQAADVIVHDRLVTPAILELGRREARRIYVGKEGHGAACRQEDISAILVQLASAGERVVRLKGGDPAVFARSGEEVAACRAAGVPVRIVPGVTTASAAAAGLATSLTHRDHAQRLQFVTGHDRQGRLPQDLDFAALADPRATSVVYMGQRTGAALAERLIREGLPATTPVILVADVSRPEEVRAHGTLADLAEGRLAAPPQRPAIILIGAALSPMATAVEAAAPVAAVAEWA